MLILLIVHIKYVYRNYSDFTKTEVVFDNPLNVLVQKPHILLHCRNRIKKAKHIEDLSNEAFKKYIPLPVIEKGRRLSQFQSAAPIPDQINQEDDDDQKYVLLLIKQTLMLIIGWRISSWNFTTCIIKSQVSVRYTFSSSLSWSKQLWCHIVCILL